MCAAIPGQVVEIGDRSNVHIPSRVDLGGTLAEVDLILVPDARIGDFVIVHSGYAIRRVGERAMAETRLNLNRGVPTVE